MRGETRRKARRRIRRRSIALRTVDAAHGGAINITERSEGTMAEAGGGEGRVRGAVLSRRRKRRLRTQPVIDAEAWQAKLGSLSDV